MRAENGNKPPIWDLSDLYQGVDDPKLGRDLDLITKHSIIFEEKYKGKIVSENLTAEFLESVLVEYKSLLEISAKPSCFAELLFSTDTTNTKHSALLQRTREVSSVASSHQLFFDLEIGQIPDEVFDQIINSPQLDSYRHYLKHQREVIKHKLSEAEEKILEQTANTRGQAFTRFFTEITSRQVFKIGAEGFTQSELLVRFHDPDREKRRIAARSLTRGLRQNTHSLNFIFNTLLHEKQVIDQLRNFELAETSRHVANEVEQPVVDTVVEVCVENYSLVEEYYRLKRQLLGIEELTHYDRYAPVGDEQLQITFEEAQQIVLEAYGEFSSELAEKAKLFFSKCWIDAAPKAGKQGGAYCMKVTPSLHPYIFMNYTGSLRDVTTLAHELGHGVHNLLASQQNILNYSPVLPMAETASTFGEMLIFEKLLSRIESPRHKLGLISRQIEGTIATVFRQIAMFRFERAAHQLRRQQGEQSAETYCNLWHETQQEMFGDSLQLGEDHKWWWLYIPHVFQAAFYVYSYAFGELLVRSLYAQYRREKESFIPKYLDLLSAGGSVSPSKLINSMGFDIRNPEFWQSGCDLIRQQIEQAKQIYQNLDSKF
ncbi:MAG: M3 family oligoendopeptidase [Candidatus Poribacteria bacterium]|nr:M3 family oligoendopeptidase [Candidatus Poribacteria bacterium]